MGSHYLIINGVKWYYRLKPKKEENGNLSKGLFSDTPRNTLTNAMVVSLSHYDTRTKKELRLYAHFKSYLEYGIYQMKLPQHERCFYEIILGECAQKPHFDLDISDRRINGEEVKDNLIDAIIKVLSDRDIQIKLETDVLVYTSHSHQKTETENKQDKNHSASNGNESNKQSYHIIINNFCHANNIEAKAFYHKVIEHVKSEFVEYIDQAVYSPSQQFRLPGSQKINTPRIKTFQTVWNYHNKEIKYQYPETPDSPEHAFVMQLESSIVGYTGNCRFLPAFEPKSDQIKHYDKEIDDVTPAEANQAINLIGKAGNINIHDSRFPYKFLGINGPIVMLKRTKPSKCKICERVHEHENPYLVVVGEEKSVYFHCRRSPNGKNLFLGKLAPSLEDSTFIPEEKKEEDVKVERVKIKWTENVIEKARLIAATGKDTKKFIISATEIDKNHKKQFIDMYVNSK